MVKGLMNSTVQVCGLNYQHNQKGPDNIPLLKPGFAVAVDYNQ